MDKDNSAFIEYISRKEIKNIISFIEKYKYIDFLNITIEDVGIKCVKLDVKMSDTSNEGHDIKFIFIYKIYI